MPQTPVVRLTHCQILWGQRWAAYGLWEPVTGANEPTGVTFPDWVKKLPPEMQKFVEEESKHGWPYVRLAQGLKLENISPEVARAIVETWMDAKRRYEEEFGKKP